jgi:hypothetical protein
VVAVRGGDFAGLDGGDAGQLVETRPVVGSGGVSSTEIVFNLATARESFFDFLILLSYRLRDGARWVVGVAGERV